MSFDPSVPFAAGILAVALIGLITVGVRRGR